MTLSEGTPQVKVEEDVENLRQGLQDYSEILLDVEERCTRLEQQAGSGQKEVAEVDQKLSIQMEEAGGFFHQYGSLLEEQRRLLRRVDHKVGLLDLSVATNRDKLGMLHFAVKDLRSDVKANSKVLIELQEDGRRVDESLNGLGQRIAKIGATQDDHTKTLNEHGRKLDEHARKLDEHGRKLDEHGQKLKEHDQRFDQVDQKLQDHDRRFDTLDDKVNTLDDKLDKVLAAVTQS